MKGYLARLRAHDFEKRLPKDLQKLQKPPFDSFCSTQGRHFPETHPPAALATAHRWWVIHYADRDPVEVACFPGATHAEIMARHPDAIAAQPITPTPRQPASPLSAEDEAAIRAWLAAIDETDPEAVADVIERCRQDQDARDYYTGQARMWEIPGHTAGHACHS